MRDLLGKLSLLAGALLFLALCGEVTLRVIHGSPVHFRYPQPHYVWDPVIGHWMQPGPATGEW